MPARLWRYGIHSFLELFRYYLFDSLDYMFSFVYLVYLMIAFLMKSVSNFKET
jgi:hypothetical protein